LAILPCELSLITIHVYFRLMPCFDIHISQGGVATCLRRGRIFKHEFVANLIRVRQ